MSGGGKWGGSELCRSSTGSTCFVVIALYTGNYSLKQEYAMPITPHANGESGAPHIHILSQFATILRVVWFAKGNGSALLPNY